MKNSKLTLPLLAMLLADAALSVLVIWLTPDDLRGTVNFWLSWTFAAIIGVAATAGLLFYSVNDKATRLIAFRSMISAAAIFEVLYIIMFVVAAYLFKENNITATVILEIVITLAYVAFVITKVIGVRFLREVNEDQAKTVEARKSTYIPGLLQKLASATAATDDESVKIKLRELSAMISASPEISHPSAEMTERELNSLVYQINQFILLREYAEIDDLLRKAKVKLSERNSKCL